MDKYRASFESLELLKQEQEQQLNQTISQKESLQKRLATLEKRHNELVEEIETKEK